MVVTTRWKKIGGLTRTHDSKEGAHFPLNPVEWERMLMRFQLCVIYLCCVSSCRPLSSTESLRQLSQQLNGLVSGVFTSTTFNSVKFHSSGVIALCHIATGVFFNRGVLRLFWAGIHLRHFQICQLLRAATSVSASSNWSTRLDNLVWLWYFWDCGTLALQAPCYISYSIKQI